MPMAYIAELYSIGNFRNHLRPSATNYSDHTVFFINGMLNHDNLANRRLAL